MKYLPLLALGLLATPAFADDTFVRAVPIPNFTATMRPTDTLCLVKGDMMVKDDVCSQNARQAPRLLLVDDVNVPARPLPNETAIPGAVAVDLTCLIQDDASLADCRLADGAKASQHDADTAIAKVNGKLHMTGSFVAGQRTPVSVALNFGKTLPLLSIR